MKGFDPDQYGVMLTVGKILGIITGTVYFVVFVYQMRDAVNTNITANIENQKVVMQVQAENHKAQMQGIGEQTKLLKQIVCQSQWNLNWGITGARYRGECEKL